MIVNMVVLQISTTWAGDEELISEISGCCLCLAAHGPRWLTAERIPLDYMIQPVPWVSDPVRHPFSPFSLPVPRGRIAQPKLTTGLSRCSLKQASPHTMHMLGQRVDHPTSGRAPLWKQDFTLLKHSPTKYWKHLWESAINPTWALTWLWSSRDSKKILILIFSWYFYKNCYWPAALYNLKLNIWVQAHVLL